MLVPIKQFFFRLNTIIHITARKWDAFTPKKQNT